MRIAVIGAGGIGAPYGASLPYESALREAVAVGIDKALLARPATKA